MSYLIIEKVPQSRICGTKLHQSFCETLCFSGLVAEKCFSYTLILVRTIGTTLYHSYYLLVLQRKQKG
jgi:hypothetical protein